jgi:hypothetical protein
VIFSSWNVPPPPPLPPELVAPSNVSATRTGNPGEVSLTWDDNSTDEEWFEYVRTWQIPDPDAVVVPNEGTPNLVPLGPLVEFLADADQTSADLQDSPRGSNLHYRVRACATFDGTDQCGDWSESFTLIVEAPVAPSTVTATPDLGVTNTVEWTWEQPSDIDAGWWLRVERAELSFTGSAYITGLWRHHAVIYPIIDPETQEIKELFDGVDPFGFLNPALAYRYRVRMCDEHSCSEPAEGTMFPLSPGSVGMFPLPTLVTSTEIPLSFTKVSPLTA